MDWAVTRDEVVIGVGHEGAPVVEAEVDDEAELEGMIVEDIVFEIGFEAHYVVVEDVILQHEVGLRFGLVEVVGEILGSAIAKVEVVPGGK